MTNHVIGKKHRRAALYAALSVVILLATGSHAEERHAGERYAVLVGVGEYTYLDNDLTGPPNDVRLARDYLIHEEGFEADNIYWLADDAPVAPVRNNILNALEDVDARIQAGDFVLLHFSGHGSRQPARAGDPDERDGYDEIFLPADADKWDAYIGSVKNAITDNELGGFISSYRNKGGDVWLIADSCHSGTMTKGVGDDMVVERYTDPVLALGVPSELGAVGAASDVLGPQGPVFADEYQQPESGMLIAFSAAHTSERAPEMPLPRRSESAEVRGLLSHNIFSTLKLFPGVSYRQLAQLVTDRYASMPWYRSTPQFYGSDMDRVVFNGSEVREALFAATREEDSTRLSVDAGTLRGFDVGAHVALHADARDVEENLIGSGTVVAALPTESEIDAQWADGAKVPDHSKLVYARLTVPAYSSKVTVSRLETKDDDDNRRSGEIISNLSVPLVEFSNDYDIAADYYATYFDGRFWLLRPGESLPCDVRKDVATADDLSKCLHERREETLLWSSAEEADDLVSKAARVRILTRLQAVVGVPGDLVVDVQVQRRGHDARVSRSDDAGPLYQGDRVFYRIENHGTAPWDVFFFYVASDLSITSLQRLGHSVRVEPEDVEFRQLGAISDSTLGAESLVVIADPVRLGDAVEADYSFLAQEPGTFEVKGAPPPGAVQAALEALWTPNGHEDDLTSKGFDVGQKDAQIRVFTWTVERR